MQRIVIYDALSALRVRMEAQPGLMFFRGVLNESRQPGLRIWVWDGPGGNARRRKIWPAYKTSREHVPGLIKAMDFVRELLELTSVWQIRIPEVEADDTIAALVEHFLEKTDLPIHIEGRDQDLAALCGPRVTCSYIPEGVRPSEIRLRKITKGKPSDDIPGIKGFGQKAWELADKAALARLVDRVIAREPWTEEEALAIGLSKASVTWLKEGNNAGDLGAMRTVAWPMPVAPELINTHLKPGRNDPVALQALMSRFML